EAEGFSVVGEAADGGTAIAEVARLRPEVVLLDVQLPDADGFAVAAELAAVAEPPAVVLISGRGSPPRPPAASCRSASSQARRSRRSSADSHARRPARALAGHARARHPRGVGDVGRPSPLRPRPR